LGVIEIEGIEIDIRDLIVAGVIDEETPEECLFRSEIVRKFVLIFLCHMGTI
jgi:hypothetical protein